MNETETKKVNWPRLLITTGLIFLTALAVGGSTWYVMEQNAKTERTASDKSTVAMQKQIDELKNTNLEKSTAQTATSITTTANPTATWKTYNGNGFQFKYPNEGYTVTTGEYIRGKLFTIVLRPAEQATQPATPSTLIVSGYVKASSTSLDNWIKTTDAVDLNYLEGLSATKIGSLDGYTFKQSGMMNYTAYAVSKDDTAFVISASNSESATFKSILSTFKLN